MLNDRRSPLIRASCGMATFGSRSASTSRCCASQPQPASARVIASRVAGTIPNASTSPASAYPTPHAAAIDRITAAHFDRCRAVISFESRTPGSCSNNPSSGGKMTAAAKTGPAQAPRPASSIPAMVVIPLAQSGVSKRRSGFLGRAAIGRRRIVYPAPGIKPYVDQIPGHVPGSAQHAHLRVGVVIPRDPKLDNRVAVQPRDEQDFDVEGPAENGLAAKNVLSHIGPE